MTLPHRLLLALLVGAIGVVGYLWINPYLFTSATTLYERGLVAKEAGMSTDVINRVALEEAARYFGPSTKATVPATYFRIYTGATPLPTMAPQWKGPSRGG
ncbi:MAG TPA: hypothetical protein VF690_12530 [Hymenobacter sp.]|jgi:hypothetical protein